MTRARDLASSQLPATTSVGAVSSTELQFVDGVTSALQTQLDAKAVAGSGGIPFRMASGTVAITTSGFTGSATVTLPSGRFTQTPNVTASCNSPSFFDPYAMTTPQSTTSLDLRVRLSASSTQTVTVYWNAVQMTSGASSG